MAETFSKDLASLDPVDQGTVRFNAAQAGMTPEAYLAMRGGVNPVTRKFGDSFNPLVDLTDEEYKAATAGKSRAEIGGAINAATGQKAYKYYISQGFSPADAEKKSGYSLTKKTFVSPDGTAVFAKNDGLMGDMTEDQKAAKSAYTLLFEQFNQYGLGALIEPLKGFITEGLSPAEFTLRLRDTDAYKKRFAANAQRVAKGLAALSEAEYIGLEDQYQTIMRNYGLPASYYARGDMGRQEGFEKFIAGDVSAAELEDRIVTAQNRVINAAPQVADALRQFYPDITNGDILAYTLDPSQALANIKRKVTAAEIGGAAMAQGLATGVARAEELGRYGVTADQARQGYQTVASVLPRGSVLADIYAKQGLGGYNQATAEQEVFGLAGSAEAERKRKKLAELEQASFSGSSGAAQGALARDRAGSF